MLKNLLSGIIGIGIGLAVLTASAQVVLTSKVSQGGTGNASSTDGELLVGSSTCSSISCKYFRLPKGNLGDVLQVSSSYPFLRWTATSSLGISGGSGWTFSSSTIWNLFSNTATGLTYSTTTGVTSLTGGYVIPLASAFPWLTSGTSVILATSTNNVGIGTSTPGYPLTVVGTSSLETATGVFWDKGGAVYNVKAYGAKCDGITDDTAVIQRVIGLATSTKGAVLIPQGICLTTSSLTLDSNLSLIGVGMGKSIIKGSATDYTILKTNYTGTSSFSSYSNISIQNLSVLSQSGHTTNLANISNLVVSNSEFYFSTTSPIRESLFIENSQYVIVYKNYLHDLTGNGVQINSTNYFTVEGNIVDGGVNADDMIDIDEDFFRSALIGSTHGAVTANVVRNGGRGNGIRVDSSQYVTVTGNDISNVTTVAAACILIDSYGGGNVNVTDTIDVVGNTISNCLSAGITTSGELTTNISLKDNIIVDSGQNSGTDARGGILLASQGVFTDNNKIINTAKSNGDGGAINVFKKSNQVITNNYIASTTNGILFWNGDALQTYSNMVVQNNHFATTTNKYVNTSIITSGNIEEDYPKKITGFGSLDAFTVVGSSTMATTTVKNLIASSSALTMTGFTNGSVLFTSLSGLVTQNNSKLFWDNTNNRLAIGTTSPLSTFQVMSSNAPSSENGAISIRSTATTTQGLQMGWDDVLGVSWIQSINKGVNKRNLFIDTANVGIGTSTPTQKLVVSGTLQVTGGSPAVGSILQSDANGIASWVATNTLGIVGTTYTGTYPIIVTGTTISSGFSTSTVNTFSAQNNFTTASTSALTGGSIFATSSLVLTSLTNGSILFSTSSGQISQNNSQIFWDNVNNRLGIGTAVPAVGLHYVQTIANGTSTLKVQNNDTGGVQKAQLFLSLSSTLTNTSVGASLLADRNNTLSAGDTDLLFQNSRGTAMNTNAIIKATGLFGIGTTTPLSQLTVQGAAQNNPLTVSSSTGATLFQVLANGNVGIGSSTPSRLLTVTSTSSMRDILPETTLAYSLGASSSRWLSAWVGTLNLGTSTFSIGQPTTNRLGFFTQPEKAGTEAISILDDGKVGIGSTTPSDLLTVQGSINVTGSVKVNGVPLSAGSGLTSLNGQTGSSQTLATTTTGTDFSVTSTGDVHTFAMPSASLTARGLVNTIAQSFAGIKTFTDIITGNATTTNLTISGLSNTFLAVNSSGQVIATTTPSGGSLSGGSTGLLALWSSATTLTTSLFMDNGTVTGIGATSSTERFNVASTTGNTMFSIGTNGQLSLATTTAATTTLTTVTLPSLVSKWFSATVLPGLEKLFVTQASSTPISFQSDYTDVALTRIVPSNGTTFTVENGGALTVACTATKLAPSAVLNDFYATYRIRYASVVTTPNQICGLFTTSETQFFRGSNTAPNAGGFKFFARVGTDAWTAGNRFFVGLTASTTPISGTSTLAGVRDTIGFGVHQGSTTMVVISNDATGNVTETTIPGMPVMSQGMGYDFYLYARPNDDRISWRVDNASTSQIIATGVVTTDLPTKTTMMRIYAAMSNATNTPANAAQISIARVIVETRK